MNRSRLAVLVSAVLPVTGTALAATAVLLLSGAAHWTVSSAALPAAGVHLLITFARIVHAPGG
ncbi:hypothetical protein P3T27_000557 [Kitasatospora sp. MAA19]|uniref:hypothetical protein n=1 Tax=Kitasatospora sp. MAA19 TaxID=3035090 RepID=UPI0024761A7D|nr:hypothetical protein [Kitasatospora sp. MAA19]MDH6703876.1 hypothetical protein [Kitasatospora sp. MAA19]